MKYLIFISVILLSYVVTAQSLEEQEQEIFVLTEKLHFAKNDKARDSVNQILTRKMKQFIQSPKSYNYDFKTVKSIGAVRSDDQKLRLYTWNTVDAAGEYHYYGFLQYYVRKKKNYVIHELKDMSAKISNPENKTLKPENWYGALYYKVLVNKYKRKRIYTILAWDGCNNFTNKKIIETLRFDKYGNAEFGLPILSDGTGVKKRIIFEYAEQAQMLLHFDKHKEMIVWDHLASLKPELKGQYMFYAPDGSYDGLFFYKGKWDFYPKLKVVNQDGDNPAGDKHQKSDILTGHK